MEAAREKTARDMRMLEQQFPMLARSNDIEQRLQAAGFGWGALDRDQDDADDDDEQGISVACLISILVTMECNMILVAHACSFALPQNLAPAIRLVNPPKQQLWGALKHAELRVEIRQEAPRSIA